MPHEKSRPMRASRGDSRSGGHLYMQTNETRNDIIHFVRSSDGSLTEVDRVSTRGAGSGVMSLIYHISRRTTTRVRSVILTPDHRLLFATNGGDNSGEQRSER